MNAVRAEQRHEELAGFSRRKGPNPVEGILPPDLCSFKALPTRCRY